MLHEDADEFTLQERRNRLRSAMTKASELRNGLIASGSQMRGMEERLPAFQVVMTAIQGTLLSTSSLQGKVDVALNRSLFLAEVLRAIQVINKTLTEDEPSSDLRRYSNAICCLDRHLHILDKCYDPAMRSLEDIAILLRDKKALGRTNEAHQKQVFACSLAERTQGSPLVGNGDPKLKKIECDPIAVTNYGNNDSDTGDSTRLAKRETGRLKNIGASRRVNSFRVLSPVDPALVASSGCSNQEVKTGPFCNMNMDEIQIGKLDYLLKELISLNPRIGGLSLLGTALDKLQDEFQNILVSNSSPMDLTVFLDQQMQIHENDQDDPLLETEVLVKMLVISDRLKVHGRASQCIQIYEETRIRYLRKAISSLSSDYLQYCSPDALSYITWEETLEFISLWIQHMHILVQVLFTRERDLINQILSRFDDAEREDCFVNLTLKHATFELFCHFPAAVALSGHTPEQRLCGLLDLFKGVQVMMEKDTGEVASVTDPLKVRLLELQKQLVHSSYRAFWELVKKVETYSADPKHDGGIDMLVSFVVNYLRTLIEFYKSPMEDVLRIQKSWRSVQTRQSGLGPVIAFMMSAVAKNLENRARHYNDAALGFLFLMNNYRYVVIRTREYLELAVYLSEGFRAEWQRKVKDYARRYVHAGWEAVPACLSLGSGDGRDAGLQDVNYVKMKLKTFYTGFETTYDEHCHWIIADPRLRERVLQSIVQVIVPSYRSFLSYYNTLLQGSVARKFVKFTPEDMQSMLENLFIRKAD